MYEIGSHELYEWQYMLCPPHMQRLSFGPVTQHTFTSVWLYQPLVCNCITQGCFNPTRIAARLHNATVDLFSIHTFTKLKTLCDGKGHGYVRPQYLDHLPEPYSPC